MALDANILAAALQDAALNQPVAASTDAAAAATYLAMAQAIIEHIKTYGVVSVSVSGTIAGTLTPPTAVAGTCSATGTGTIA